jgi:transposase
MTQVELISWLRHHVGRGGPATANRILACARDALLPPPEISAVLARQVQADFAFYQQLAERLNQLKRDAEQLVPGSSAAVLTSVPGLSPYLAARYLAGIGQATRFDSAAQVWALAGFDPLSADSGDTRRAGRISKKGDPAFRDTLFLLGFQTSQTCPAIAAAKARACERGLGFTGAVLHAAHKANRLCWHLLTQQEPYQPPRV